jgi:hypothetical protein
MKVTTDITPDKSQVYARLDTIRMSALERRHVYASLRDGERIAELLLRAAAGMRAIARYVERACASLVGGIRTVFAKPVKH